MKHVGTVLSEGTGSAETLNVSDLVCTLVRKDARIALTLRVVSALSADKKTQSSLSLNDISHAVMAVKILKAVDGGCNNLLWTTEFMI